MIEFTIFGEAASMKNSREIVKFGGVTRLIKSEKARNFEASVMKQIPPAARQMLTCRLRVTVRMYYASERPDLDPELLYDALAAKYKRGKGKLKRIAPGEYVEEAGERVLISKGVYVNDRQLREKHAYHAIDKANPRIEISIEPMDPQQASLIIEEPDVATHDEDPF